MDVKFNPLFEEILQYYKGRQLKLPDAWESLAFATTELGEVYELLLARKGGWTRNNPENKPTFSREALAEELGDVIMMVMVAGISEGVDPIDALESKIERKLKAASFKSSLEIIDGEPDAS
jgi:NTP pyrophosphatase (non-canonical NTP hydrolase)